MNRYLWDHQLPCLQHWLCRLQLSFVLFSSSLRNVCYSQLNQKQISQSINQTNKPPQFPSLGYLTLKTVPVIPRRHPPMWKCSPSFTKEVSFPFFFHVEVAKKLSVMKIFDSLKWKLIWPNKMFPLENIITSRRRLDKKSKLKKKWKRKFQFIHKLKPGNCQVRKWIRNTKYI